MDSGLLSVITTRHCKRAFLPRPVPPELLRRVLTAAGHAPSTRNTQFWQVEILTGEARAALSARLCAALDADEPRRPDYPNRPEKMGAVHEQRSQAWGAAYYGALGIARADRAGREEVERRNLRFYGAPVAMIFHLPADAVPGTFLEMGFFLQNVMLGLVSCGLGSCPQYSIAQRSETIRDFLRLGSERLVVCGLSVGYVDESAPVNGFYPERAELGDYAHWHSQPPADPAGA